MHTTKQLIAALKMVSVGIEVPDLKYLADASALRLAELEAQARDAARLQFMIDNQARVIGYENYGDGYWLVFPDRKSAERLQTGVFPTPRAAIDAASAAQGGAA